MVWYVEKVAIATVMVLMGEENQPKSQCYGFEQEMAVDVEKVVMVLVSGGHGSSLDELLTLGASAAAWNILLLKLATR